MAGFALITGASAGIGKVFAREATALEFEGLILVARRKERLEELKAELALSGYKGEVRVLACDLRDHLARSRLQETLNGTAVELLINNAGFGYVGSFLSDSPDNIVDMVSTNCSAPLHLARLFLPQMVERKRGGVINVASVAAYPPLPYMACYGATKALLLNWSVALREELRGTGVKVLALCPGPTESDFHIVAGVQEKIAVVPAMSAEEVVKQAFQALNANQAIKINGLRNTLVAELTRLFPRGVVASLGRRILHSRVPQDRL
jgi:uncharacterized protein